MKFDFVYLGQTVLKYEVPLEIFVGLNEIYEKQKKQFPKANKQLVGKIQDEVSLFYAGPNNDKMHQHNFLPQDILRWFHSIFDHYTDWNKIGRNTKSINSIWVNEMKANEYNPVHMRHCVYPFNSTKETRRTLVCNVDVDYDPVSSRTGSGQME